MAKTEAELAEFLVAGGLDYYEELYTALLHEQVRGGRYIGLPKLSSAEMLALYEQTPAEAFHAVAMSDEKTGDRLLAERERLEEQRGLT